MCRILLLSFLIVSSACAGDYFHTFQVAVSQSLYSNATFRAKWEAAYIELYDLTDTPENKALAWEGWLDNREHIPTGTKVYLYRDSILNMKRRKKAVLSSAKVQYYINKIKTNPNIEISCNKTPHKTEESWQLKEVWGAEP